jgi:transposase
MMQEVTFQGISDAQWQELQSLLKAEKARGRGRPAVSRRFVINVIIWMALHRAPWRMVPKGSIWASKSSAHSHWQVWAQDGTLARLRPVLARIAQQYGPIVNPAVLEAVAKPESQETNTQVR